MSSQTTMILIGVVACCCVSSVVAGGLWAGNVFCDTANPDDQAVGMNCASVYERSPAPAPAQVATDPRASVWSTGQMIQSAPVLISVATPPTPTNKPTGLTAGAAATSYTISLDIKTSGKPTDWLRVYGADPHPGYPGVWLQPTTILSASRVLKVHFGGPDTTGDGSITGLEVPTTTTVPFNSYFNLVVVYDSISRTGTLYFNGTKVATKTSMPAFNWPSPPDDMKFNGALPPKTDITVNVGNVYWWNSVLSDAQIAQLKVPSAPTPGVATTSYYMPEPYTVEKDFAGY